MADIGETVTYNVQITLSTERGEMPGIGEVTMLISDQMTTDVLDEETGLRCIGVFAQSIVED